MRVIGQVYFLLLALTIYTVTSEAQSSGWVWVNGTDTTLGLGYTGTLRDLGNYGDVGIGVPSASIYPRALYQAAQWQDKYGNMLIYLGMNYTGSIVSNEMWEYK